MLSNSNIGVIRERRKPKLADAFYHWFTTVSAATPALLEQAYRLRYQVYCVENSYENPGQHPSGYEKDEFDVRSVHTLLFERQSGAAAGTARLILPNRIALEKSFPIQRICKYPLLADRGHFTAARPAEISRFAVSKEFRQMTPDSFLPDWRDSFLADRRIVMPYITLGLMNGIIRMCIEQGITDLFAVMEPALLRLLSRFGIYFRPIGPLVDYHGMRQPCHADIESLLTRVRKERSEVWEVITDCGKLLDRYSRTFPLCS